jgi:hypothetical protein
MTRAQIHQVQSRDAWIAFASSGAVEVYEAVRLSGPMDDSAIARLIGWSKASVARVTARLARHGLLRRRKRAGADRYEVIAEELVPGFVAGTTALERREVGKMIGSMLASTSHLARRSTRSGALEIDARLRNFTAYYELSYLTTDQFAAVRTLVRDITRIMAAGRRQRVGRPYAAMLTVFPMLVQEKDTLTCGKSPRRRTRST